MVMAPPIWPGVPSPSLVPTLVISKSWIEMFS